MSTSPSFAERRGVMRVLAVLSLGARAMGVVFSYEEKVPTVQPLATQPAGSEPLSKSSNHTFGSMLVAVALTVSVASSETTVIVAFFSPKGSATIVTVKVSDSPAARAISSLSTVKSEVLLDSSSTLRVPVPVLLTV